MPDFLEGEEGFAMQINMLLTPAKREAFRWAVLALAVFETILILAVVVTAFFKVIQPAQASPLNRADSDAPQYHKKVSLYKRVVAPADLDSIRSSALSPGYQALAAIPPAVVAPPVSIRWPQYLHPAAMSNYQALSTLGTQQYYSNLNVQQLLTSLSNQRYLLELNNQIAFNNLANQQYLNQYNNTLNFNAYVNNFNNLNNQQYLNNFNNTLTFQSYLNNFNNLNNQFLNPSTTFTNPNYFQPPTFNYQPPTFIQPPIIIQPQIYQWP
jgi:hypothetical protein